MTAPGASALTADAVPRQFHRHGAGERDDSRLSRRTGALSVSTFEVSNRFGERECNTRPLRIGGGRRFDFGHVKPTIAHLASTGL